VGRCNYHVAKQTFRKTLLTSQVQSISKWRTNSALRGRVPLSTLSVSFEAKRALSFPFIEMAGPFSHLRYCSFSLIWARCCLLPDTIQFKTGEFRSHVGWLLCCAWSRCLSSSLATDMDTHKYSLPSFTCPRLPSTTVSRRSKASSIIAVLELVGSPVLFSKALVF